MPYEDSKVESISQVLAYWQGVSNLFTYSLKSKIPTDIKFAVLTDFLKENYAINLFNLNFYKSNQFL